MTRIALCLVLAFAFAGCTSGGSGSSRSVAVHGPTTAASSSATPASAAGCRTSYPSRLLPTWARAGLPSARPSAPYVLGDRGDIAAIVWVSHDSLASPPVAGKHNKILWVAGVGAVGEPLQIRAVLAGTTQTVTRTVAPAPGPSVIDLPSPGCWSFDLTWGRHHDHLQLGYVPG